MKITPKELKHQQGFTLVELMISIVLGLIVTAATLTAYITTIRSNADYLKMTQLNQELNVIMNYMTRDIRRAAYWADAGVTSPITANPFNDASSSYTRLGVVPASSISYATALTYATTLTYAYDTDGTGGFDCSSDMRGFRYDTVNNAVDTKLSAAGGGACQITRWQNISDENIVQINTLRFGVFGSTVRSVVIELAGSLVDDPTVRRSLTGTVRIRNDNVL